MIVVGRVARWFDERLRLASLTKSTLAKVFPDHWSFMLGEIALYSFVSLVVTGTFLTLFFEPDTSERIYDGSYAPMHGQSVSAAYASTVELSWDVRAGLLMRQTHHWAALVFIAAIVVHLCRIFFTAAFRRPRELNWVVGLTLFLLAVFNGFAGYSLPDDLLSGTGLRIAWSVVLSLPVVGGWLAMLAFGGEFPGQVIPRLYVAHILLVPGLIVALITLHMAILVRQKHTQFPGPGRRNTTVVGSKLWPTYAFRSLALLTSVFAVLFALGGLVQINPVWLWGAFTPDAVTSPAQPDWYVGWVDGALRLYPPVAPTIFGYRLPNPFIPGVLMPGVTFLVMYAWPWIDKVLSHDRRTHHVLDRPRDHPGRVAIGVWALGFYSILLLAAANDLIARYFQVPITTVVWIMRGLVIGLPFIMAGVAYVVARSLRDSGVKALADLPLSDLRLGHASERETDRATVEQPEDQRALTAEVRPEPSRERPQVPSFDAPPRPSSGTPETT